MTTLDSSTAKNDSKGRILLPPSLREKLDLKPGDVVSLRRIKGAVLVTRSGKSDHASKFKRMLATPPTRLGKPLNPTPSKMKKIWRTGEVLMDKQMTRRIKMGKKEYFTRDYVVAKGAVEIRKALSS